MILLHIIKYLQFIVWVGKNLFGRQRRYFMGIHREHRLSTIVAAEVVGNSKEKLDLKEYCCVILLTLIYIEYLVTWVYFYNINKL